jgi:hypothetical protein
LARGSVTVTQVLSVLICHRRQELRWPPRAFPRDCPERSKVRTTLSAYSRRKHAHLETLRRSARALACCLARSRSKPESGIDYQQVGTVRRECLDFLIPLGRRHLKHILNCRVRHYNHGRVHMSLGPGVPAPDHPSPPQTEDRHRLPTGHRVCCKAVLGGLHHEYWLEKIAA